ncbi:MAG: hypothetical protein QF463_13480 [Vicinamibacterales bacterium]|nr:hypothetical protein [Vicinamibacterales bacterium]MDP6610075.1 hypothetical protein [Vicinamibacterales bacterium]|tara:strand:+ start:253 stop:408 length:156 start_codon:yes stop_codon:yes gene_type:complete
MLRPLSRIRRKVEQLAAEIDDARLRSPGTYTIEATARGRSHLGNYYIEVTE